MKTILRRMVPVSALALALSLGSCVSPYAGPAERDGAVIGALGGAALGGIIGNQSGRGLEGAAIGGVLGSLAGASIGSSRDDRYYNGYGRSYYGRPTHYRGSPYGYGYRPVAYRSGYGYPGYYGGGRRYYRTY